LAKHFGQSRTIENGLATKPSPSTSLLAEFHTEIGQIAQNLSLFDPIGVCPSMGGVEGR
jgi:hypothetical protein